MATALKEESKTATGNDRHRNKQLPAGQFHQRPAEVPCRDSAHEFHFLTVQCFDLTPDSVRGSFT
jgi:hypothetical protein